MRTPKSALIATGIGIFFCLTAQGTSGVQPFHPGQQGPPNAPPSTAPPSEPVEIVPTPPPQPPDFEQPKHPVVMKRRYDPIKTRKDAQQLAKLASSIPTEVDSLSDGQLPKDLPRRLKEIQKLAKRLRGEITP